jgi:GTP-binding protein
MSGQFHKLGLGDPITISALLGRKIGDFLDEVTKGFSSDGEEPPADERLRLAIVGRPNVGKSSFVNAVLGKPRAIVTEIPGTTRDSIDTLLKYQKEEIVLIDTAGLRRKSRVEESVEFYSALRSLKSIDRCDVAVLMIDVSSGVDRQDLRIVEMIADRKRGALIAANKWDLIEKNDQTAKEYERALRKLLRKYDYIPIVFISARDKQRVYKVIDIAGKIHAERQKRIPTNKLNTVMLKEVHALPPSSPTGKDININYVTQVRSNPPAIAFFANHPKLVEEQYRRFLENKIREHFGFEGVPLTLYFRDKN